MSYWTFSYAFIIIFLQIHHLLSMLWTCQFCFHSIQFNSFWQSIHWNSTWNTFLNFKIQNWYFALLCLCIEFSIFFFFFFIILSWNLISYLWSWESIKERKRERENDKNRNMSAPYDGILSTYLFVRIVVSSLKRRWHILCALKRN